MSTGIEWTDETWNPVVGCTKVSPGCKFCYAKTIHDMRHKATLEGKKLAPQYAEPFETVQLKPERLEWPLSWRTPLRIFVNSVSDLFHDDVPREFLDQVYAVMALAQWHTFQVLTKRPYNMRVYMNDPETPNRVMAAATAMLHARDARGPRDRGRKLIEIGRAWHTMQWPPVNVWHGTSVENQHEANHRITLLLYTKSAVRFLSCEPLLGPVDLTKIGDFQGTPMSALEEQVGFVERPKLDWVIVGGESGTKKQDVRPMDVGWARSLRDQCTATRTPFLFKQHGDYVTDRRQFHQFMTWVNKAPTWLGSHSRCIDADGRVLRVGADWAAASYPVSIFHRIGKKRAGRELDGRTWDEYPASRVPVASAVPN